MTSVPRVTADVNRPPEEEDAVPSSLVLHVSNTDIENDSRIRKELRALQRLAGVAVCVIGVPASDAQGAGPIDGARYDRVRLASRRLAFLSRATRYAFELVEFTAKAVRRGYRLSPAVVHCHDTFALPAGWLLKKLTGCRLVYDAHELESDKNGQSAVLAAATLFIERACWREIDLLISVSQSIIEWYRKELGSKQSLLILNSPMIREQESGALEYGQEDRLRQGCGIPQGHLVFVYLGILGPGRGIEMCLDAFEEGPAAAHVVFVGFGALEEEIRRRAAGSPNIHFHEAVPHDQVVSLIRGADYGLCMVENASLSDYYCLPNKLFEYCFAGLPVLASNFPEISEVVSRYSLGVCCAPNPGELKAAVAALIAGSRKKVAVDLSALSWEEQESRLKEAYLALLEPGRD